MHMNNHSSRSSSANVSPMVDIPEDDILIEEDIIAAEEAGDWVDELGSTDASNRSSSNRYAGVIDPYEDQDGILPTTTPMAIPIGASMIHPNNTPAATPIHNQHNETNTNVVDVDEEYNSNNDFTHNEFVDYNVNQDGDYVPETNDNEIIQDHNQLFFLDASSKLRLLCVSMSICCLVLFPFTLLLREANESTNVNNNIDTLDGIQPDDNNNNKPNSGGLNINNNVHNKPVLTMKPLPNPPTNLQDICTIQNLQTDDGYEACQNVCKDADCCEFPITMDLSCVFGNEVKCLRYHENCIHLDYTTTTDTTTNQNDATAAATNTNNIQIPKAPLDIDILCNHDTIASIQNAEAANDNNDQDVESDNGYRVCEMACSGAECCYDNSFDGPSCINSNPNCAGYAPCIGLKSLTKVHDKIKKEVDKKCDMQNLYTVYGRDECLDVCAHALCCYAQDIVGPCPMDDTTFNNDDDGNDHNDNEFCAQYDACSNVFDVSEEQIKSFCDPIIGDKGTCMHLCFPARCCFDHGECFDDIQYNDCDKYQSCQHVFPPATTTSATTTSTSTLTDDDDDDDEVEDNNNDNTNNNGASSSSSSSSSSTGLFTTSQIIHDACFNHNNDGAQFGRQTLCEEICEPGACCFYDNVANANSNDNNNEINPATTTISCISSSNNDNDSLQGQEEQLIDCTIYQQCAILYPNSASGSSTAAGSGSSLISLAAEISQACDFDSETNYDDRTACVQLCVQVACCYTLEIDRSCASIGRTDIICSQYTACDAIFYV